MPTSHSAPIVLLRGRQLDGDGTVLFEGQRGGLPDALKVIVDGADGSGLFYNEIRLPDDSNAAFYTYLSASGCYALQADSGTFSEVIVFKAA